MGLGGKAYGDTAGIGQKGTLRPDRKEPSICGLKVQIF